ncbi:uncharacterized protein LOC120627383 [Pararge aegeria]|nr:uncharacterized protein LOC120627383 [Pararge aegeria]
MQEVFTHIERDYRWCNMKVNNRGQRVDELLYKWHATGTVNYTNSFVVSIEKIDLTNIVPIFGTTTVNGTQTTVQNIRGQVNLRELTLGFDVTANLDDSGTHRFTGEYSHLLVSFVTLISWNSNTNELTTTANAVTTTSNNRRMVYKPANNITEMLSRGFHSRDNDDSFVRWARDIIAPLMQEVAAPLKFPTVRFDGRC